MKYCLRYKILMLSVLCCSFCLAVQGQNMSDISSITSSELEAKDSTKVGWFERGGIGIGGGTKGLLAFDMAFQVRGNWNVRVGVNWFKIVVDQFESDFQGAFDSEIRFDADLRQSTVELLTEYGFLKGAIRVVGGVSYALDNALFVNIGLAEDYQLNDVVLSPEEVGSLGGTLTYSSPWSSYMGIGFGRTIPRKRVSLNLDLGLYIKGIPQLDIVASGIFKSNEENEAVLNAALASDTFYQIWPVGQLRVAITLFKPAVSVSE